MTKTIELALQVSLDGELPAIQVFAELVRADERARLLAVAGEPTAVFYKCVICEHQYEGEPVSECDCSHNAKTFTRLVYYTADQVAAAVLKERMSIADELEHGFFDDEGHHVQYAAEIRARGEG